MPERDPLHFLESMLEGVQWRGKDYFVALCPAHEETRPSLHVSRGRTHPVVLMCHAGCEKADILRHLGITFRDLLTERPNVQAGARDVKMPCGARRGWGDDLYDVAHHKVAEYRYEDAAGNLVFAVARCALKGQKDTLGKGLCAGFAQWKPNPENVKLRKWKLDGTGDGLPYRLPQVLTDLRKKPLPPTLWVVEGEKDVERLNTLGYTATCSAAGAGKWKQAHADHFKGLKPDVMIVADLDAPGWKHAVQVAKSFDGIARSIEIMRAAVDEPGADLSDHLDAGKKMHELITLSTPLGDPGLNDIEVW